MNQLDNQLVSRCKRKGDQGERPDGIASCSTSIQRLTAGIYQVDSFIMGVVLAVFLLFPPS
jgi:hypothetical protein